MKSMIVTSKIKHKFKTILRVIRNLVLDFILYFVAVCMRKCPVHVTSARGKTQNTLYITCGILNPQSTIYNSNYSQHTFKVITMKNDRVFI